MAKDKQHHDQMEALERALEAESLEWMLAQHPEIVDAIQAALSNGVRPEDIRWRVMRHTLRPEIAKRCELVARALVGE
jgi:hypothetical protein